MEIQVNMTIEDSQAVEKPFVRFNAYCNILGYLAQYGSLDTALFDKKWEEAVQINIELEKVKLEMKEKYYPHDGNTYSYYEFDFDKKQLVYRTDA